MPIREYQCPACGVRRERIEQLNEKPPPPACYHGRGEADCPNPTPMRLLVSVPAPAQFKGSGFHATDYGGKGE